MRLAGVALVAAGLAMSPFTSRPDILIERTGANVAVRNDTGLLVPAAPRRSRFAVENWLQQDGDNVTMSQAAGRHGWTCSDNACQAAVKGFRVAYLNEGADADRACRDIDIVITDFPLRGGCREVPVRIDRFDVWRHGSHAISIRGGAIHMTTAAERRGSRLWATPPVPRQSIREAEVED